MHRAGFAASPTIAAGTADRLFRDIPTGPFYGFNRPGAKVSQGIIDNWWRQGMMCGVKAAYDCIKAFSETDFTEDLNAQLKVYKGLPHGMATTQHEVINADLLAFFKA